MYFSETTLSFPTIVTSETTIALKASPPACYLKMGVGKSFSNSVRLDMVHLSSRFKWIAFEMRVNHLTDTHLLTSFAKVFLIT